MPFDPTWKRFEEKMSSDDVETSQKATDAFLEEREKEMQTSARARRWEEDRKRSWANDKPHFSKKLHSKEEQFNKSLISQLRNGGDHAMPFTPARGFVLVQVPEREVKTDTGIFLPDEVVDLQNTGHVYDVGGPIVNDGLLVSAPCNPGDTILMKKGAGLQMRVEGRECLFIQFSDVLGVFHD